MKRREFVKMLVGVLPGVAGLVALRDRRKAPQMDMTDIWERRGGKYQFPSAGFRFENVVISDGSKPIRGIRIAGLDAHGNNRWEAIEY